MSTVLQTNNSQYQQYIHVYIVEITAQKWGESNTYKLAYIFM